MHKQLDFSIWHKSLGHAPVSKLRYVDVVPKRSQQQEVYLTCPMAKFAKLPYALGDSHATESFELIHIDIWGAYRVPAHGKFRYFLTIVDDYTRATWVYLLQSKSQALSVIQKNFALCEKLLWKTNQNSEVR